MTIYEEPESLNNHMEQSLPPTQKAHPRQLCKSYINFILEVILFLGLLVTVIQPYSNWYTISTLVYMFLNTNDVFC